MKRTSARIVVSTTASEKDALVSKVRRLKFTIEALMLCGAFAYEPDRSDAELGVLADAAKAAAERACASIDRAYE